MSRFHGRKGATLSGMKVAFMDEGISKLHGRFSLDESRLHGW